MNESDKYDVAIIGSGFGGSILGTILARQGFRVVIFEYGTHPRFAIGESLIIEASEVLRSLATIYDVPEIAYYSSENYFCKIGTSHGVKRHFSFIHHKEGHDFTTKTALQAIIPKEPYGHELHIYRQDCDYFFTSIAIKYGVTVFQNTRVEDVGIDDRIVEIIASGSKKYYADYIVDSGGYRSILAAKYNLRDYGLETHSRSIFTHMIDVPSYHKVTVSKEEYGVPYSFAEGTLHHIFKGGWIWVIPFNNHTTATNPLCSVGMMVDPRVYPMRNDLNPEEEFFSFIRRFPSINIQFENAKAVRDWIRTDRIQYSSKKIVGNRFCLMGHAAGFIDPLFSKGLYISLSCLNVLANQLIAAKKVNDYSESMFKVVENTTINFVRSGDILISHAFKSFYNFKLWSVYSVLWLIGAYLEGLKLATSHIQFRMADKNAKGKYFNTTKNLKLTGGGFPEFDVLSGKVQKIISQVDPDNEQDVDGAVAEIQVLYDETVWIPFVMKEIAHGKNHLPITKFRSRLFRKNGGLMGNDKYREYFFNDISWFYLGKHLLKEKINFTPKAISKNQTYVL